MILQQVNRTDAEKVWGAFTNTAGTTVTIHLPVFAMTMHGNSASVNGNDGGLGQDSYEEGPGSFLGLANANVAANTSGLYQCYGYHASCNIYQIVGSVTVVPGHPLGPGASASLGLCSNGAVQGLLGPVVALDTVTATMISLGAAGTTFTNHVFIRAM